MAFSSSSILQLSLRQTRILNRISHLETLVSFSSLSISEGDSSGLSTEDRLSGVLTAAGVKEFEWRRVVGDYYDRGLEERRDIVGARRVEQLCKSIVMVNTQAGETVTDCTNPKNSKYYIVVIQYTARLNAENIKNFLYALNEKKIPKKRFNMRLAPEEESLKLTGFIHNAVTCIGMQTNIPVIIDEAITKLEEDFFWLGGGEVDLKLGMKTSEFINAFKPFVVNCS